MKNTGSHTWIETQASSYGAPVEWHHVALVLSRNNNKFDVYHDGTKKASGNLDTDEDRTVGTGHVVIGSETAVYRPASLDPSPTTTAGGPYLSGIMNLDELTMWNKVLSSNEVNKLKNAIN